jgi:hypothetical protein
MNRDSGGKDFAVDREDKGDAFLKDERWKRIAAGIDTSDGMLENPVLDGETLYRLGEQYVKRICIEIHDIEAHLTGSRDFHTSGIRQASLIVKLATYGRRRCLRDQTSRQQQNDHTGAGEKQSKRGIHSSSIELC